MKAKDWQCAFVSWSQISLYHPYWTTAATLGVKVTAFVNQHLSPNCRATGKGRCVKIFLGASPKGRPAAAELFCTVADAIIFLSLDTSRKCPTEAPVNHWSPGQLGSAGLRGWGGWGGSTAHSYVYHRTEPALPAPRVPTQGSLLTTAQTTNWLLS